MLLEQIFDALEMNNFSVTNVVENETQREIQTMI